ncbi:hypothetical protein FJT64_025054 [Amphibalanus amphitrite]|uniref:Uncharacterized protein n=1 Tax=Amphibalanus amphitrite TaxID=1232801 RepID=A0A6A4W8U4_AMPAM|nr:hypothetical protein FJT64_025054 [Amphibalanus amphitrite]
MIGPTPKPSRDAPGLRRAEDGGAVVEAKWEATAAFRCLDRPVHRWLGGEDRLRVRHLSVGKWVLERRRESRKVSAYMLSRAALANFDDDGVHLSPAGYEKLAGRTGWLNWLQPSRQDPAPLHLDATGSVTRQVGEKRPYLYAISA